MSSRIGKSAREHANCTSRMHAAIRASMTASHVAERWRHKPGAAQGSAARSWVVASCR
jgi:hypothetical protein